jgi:hypothetical protein
MSLKLEGTLDHRSCRTCICWLAVRPSKFPPYAVFEYVSSAAIPVLQNSLIGREYWNLVPAPTLTTGEPPE